VRHRDGHYLTVRDDGCAIFDVAGEVARVVGFIVDITERKRAEEALRQREDTARRQWEDLEKFYQTAPIGLVHVDRDYRYIRINQVLADINGVPIEDHLGRTVHEVVPGIADQLIDLWRPVFERGESVLNVDLHGTVPGTPGVERDWLVNYFPLRTDDGTVVGTFGAVLEITERKRAEALVAGQKRVLEMIAVGAPLAETLTALTRLVESQASGVLSSLLLLDADGAHLRHGAAPSLPIEYTQAIDGLAIGPRGGSCGTSAFRREPVVVTDIESDPLWEDYRALATPHGLRACWSTPIFGANHTLLGTFAMYYRQPKAPDSHHLHLIEVTAQTAAIAIERARAEETLRRSEASLEAAQERAHIGSWEYDLRTRQARWSRQMYRLFDRDPALTAPTYEEFLQLVHPEDRGRVRNVFDRPGTTFAPAQLDFRSNPAQAPPRYFNATVHVVRDADGRPTMTAGTIIDVTERARAEQLVGLEHGVTRCLAEAEDVATALEAVIRVICETQGWECGRCWRVDEEAELLRFVAGWSAPGSGTEDFIAESRTLTFAKGVGLAGWVWQTGAPLWVPDITKDVRVFATGLSRLAGVRSGFVFPITSEGKTIGAYSITSRDVREPDERLLAAVQAIGSQVGQYLQRKQAESVLRESEERFRRLIELSSDWYYEQDAQFHYTQVSGDLHVSNQMLLGNPRWGTGIVPLGGDWSDHRATLEAHRPFRDFRAYRDLPGGERHYFSVDGEPMFETDGRFKGYRGVVRDITDRTRAEAAVKEWKDRYEIVIQASGHVLYDRNVRSNEVTYGGSLERTLGYTVADMTGGLVRWLDLVQADDQPRFQAELDRMFGAKEPFRLEYRMRRKDGRYIVVQDEGHLLLDANGAIGRVVGLVVDVTERKRAEEHRIRLESQLRQSQKMEALGTLAGGIAHDFNNVLAAIAGNAKLAIADLPANHPAQPSLAEIEKSGRRASNLVRQILAFSRQEEPDRRPIDLRPVVEDALALLRATLPAMIEIRTQFASELPLVSADATQIHQVIMNLGTNAAHAIGGRAGLIEVRLDAVALTPELASASLALPEGRYVRLSLMDDGCGMDAATLERIFEPFFTTKARGEGTGLGLPVVHGIVQSHEGAITAYSALGKGTTFHVYFPAVEVDAALALPRPVATESVRGEGERVLYVDDEEALVFLAERVLKRLGYRVSAYTDPAAALEAFRARPDDFDVVVTDLSMPEMSGRDLARGLLQIRPDVPIVLTSGYVRSEDVESAKQLGIRDVLLKPNTVEDLGKVLHALLGGLERRGG